MLFVAIDDHARIALTAMHPDEKTPQAVQFLKDAVAHYAKLGVSIQAATERQRYGVPVTRLRSCLPGARNQAPVHTGQPAADERKAERFIQSALREWTCGWTYQNSSHRAAALASWQHHYNWHRPHSGIGGWAHMPSSAAWPPHRRNQALESEP